VELGLAHGALETKQEAIVEVGWVVETVLVKDESVGQSADLEHTVPVHGTPCQPGHLQTEHYPDLAHTNRSHQLLETLTIAICARDAQVAVYHHDPIRWPAKGDGTFLQTILSLRALRILEDLTKRALPHIKVSLPLEVARGDLLMLLDVDAEHLLWLPRAISVSSRTSSALSPAVLRSVPVESREVATG
jgi:hypothetical protein